MFSTRSILTSSALTCSLLAGLAQAEDTSPSTGGQILFGPTDDCTIGVESMELEIHWTAFLAEPITTTFDLSADVLVEVGDYSAVQTVRVFADPGAGFNPTGAFGGEAGTGSIDGVPVVLLDLSENGDYFQFPWIKTSFSVPMELFDENDVVEARLVPSPSSQVEFDPSDFSIDPVGDTFYDRTFESVELVPVPGAQDLYDIVVEYQLAYNTSMPPIDLRTDIVMEHNGQASVFETWCGPWLTTPFSDCGDCTGQVCAEIKCGNDVVTTLKCQPYENAFGAFDCACVSQPIRFTIPSVQILDGDELDLCLTHAPGAMAEPTGLDDDKWVVCTKEAQSSTYGQGKAGTFGVPVLDSSAKPILGQVTGIKMTNALPGALPVLFLGFQPLNAPFAGGTLLVDPSQVLFLPAPVAADGSFTLEALLPNDPPLCGASAYFQMMFLDPGAAGPKTIAMTNGLNQIFGW